MSYDKAGKILRKLAAKTEAGQVEWGEAATENAFEASFSDYSIVITAVPTETEDEPDYKMEIYDSAGSLVQSVWDEDLDEDEDERPYYDVMEDLFYSARGYAIGVEQALDSLLEDLE